MNYTLDKRLDSLALSRIIEDVKVAELSRDTSLPQKIFRPIWNNVEIDPDFSSYDISEQAELYRLSGYFISNYGKAKNIPYYQERAKNLLIRSIELFSALKLIDRVSEANVILALCYFYEGAIIESELILKQISRNYETNNLHPVYLKICINWLLVMTWKSEFKAALEVIEKIKIPVEFCQDKNLNYMFHTQAGIIYRRLGQLDKAIYHYNKSIEIAQEFNYSLGIALNQNNLAFLYKHTKNFEVAHSHIELSINIFRELNHIGWLPHAIDTKALIYFDEGKFDLALHTIDEAINILQTGEDFAVLVDSLWNKVRCLIELNRKEEAIVLFTQLSQIAQTRIGEVAVRKYSKLFADIIYVKQENPLEEEVRRFKKTEIIFALRQTEFNFEEAAKLLKLSAKKLIGILNNEFPELYAELDIPKLEKYPKIRKVKDIIEENSEVKIYLPKLINELQLHNVNYNFEPAISVSPKTAFKSFYISSEKIPASFKVFFDALLAVVTPNKIAVNDVVLIKKLCNNNLSVVRISQDKDLNVLYLIDEDKPFSLDEVEIIGKVIGYCPFAEIDSNILHFKSLPNS